MKEISAQLMRFPLFCTKCPLGRKIWIMVAAFAIIITAASGVRFLEFSENMRVFFSKEDPQLKALEALENTYTKYDNVLLAIAPRDNNVFTRQTLAAIEELTQTLWETPYSSRVDSITNFQHTRAEGDELIVENLVQNAMTLTNADIERIKQITLSEPLLVNRLISPTGHVTGVNVMTITPDKSLGEIPEIVRFVRKKVEEFRHKYPELDIYLTGGVIVGGAMTEAGQRDMQTLMPLMFAIMVIVIFISLGSISGTLATIIIIISSVATGMGIAGWLGIKLTPATTVAPIIILTLAIAGSIHILTTMFYYMRRGKSKQEAISESLRDNMYPVFLTSATTAIGFLSMNFSDSPPFRDLGNMVALGVMAAYLYSISLLPVLMSILPLKVKAIPKGKSLFMDRFGDFVVRRRKVLLWGMAALMIVLSLGLFRIELNDDFVKYFGKRLQVRTDTDFVEKNLSGIFTIEYSLYSGEEGGISNPEYLAKVEEFANWFRAQPRVKNVNSITDIMKRLNLNMHGDDPAYYRIPDQRSLAAQYLLLYEMSVPFGMDLNNQINVDKSSTRLTVLLENLSSREIRDLEERGRQWLKENAPPEMFTYGTGLSLIFAYFSKRNINSMLGGTILALILISGILMFALRSVKIGLLSLLPNLTPAMMAIGLWGFVIGQVGVAVSVIGVLSLGLVVDDTIHFLSKYLRAKRELGKNSAEAVRYAFHTVGRALFSTSVILASGFLVLSLSGFKINAWMGLLTAIAIGFALMGDFLFLPPLLLLTKWPGSKSK